MIRNRKLNNYLYGMKQAIPVLIGFLPVAISYAILAVGSGLSAVETIAMSAAVFAGASQIMSVGMIGGGAQFLSVVVATFVLNLRHIIMSTCVFNRLHTKNFLLRLLCGFGVTDETFALYTTEEEERCDAYFMLGLITVSYSSWVLGTVIGVFASNLLPTALAQSFGIALYALFLALLVPDVKKDIRLLLTVGITVLLNCLFMFVIHMDSSWAIVCSTLLGAAIGVWMIEGKAKQAQKEKEEGV